MDIPYLLKRLNLMTSSSKSSGGGESPSTTIEEVVDLLLNWYIQKTGPSHIQTKRDTERILRLYGKIKDAEKPLHPMRHFVTDK